MPDPPPHALNINIKFRLGDLFHHPLLLSFPHNILLFILPRSLYLHWVFPNDFRLFRVQLVPHREEFTFDAFLSEIDLELRI